MVKMHFVFEGSYVGVGVGVGWKTGWWVCYKWIVGWFTFRYPLTIHVYIYRYIHILIMCRAYPSYYIAKLMVFIPSEKNNHWFFRPVFASHRYQRGHRRYPKSLAALA